MKYNFDRTQNHRLNESYRWGMEGMPDDVIGMGTADLDYDCAPCIRETLMKVASENCYNYRQHKQEYYDAVIGWYQKNYGFTVKKEWLSNVPSTIGAVRIALGMLTVPGDCVILQTPVFAPLKWAAEGAELNIVENPMKIVENHYEIDFDDFEMKIRECHPKVYLMVNPHNPTGRVFTKAELERIVDICYRYGVYIISDEVHSLILYQDYRHVPVLAVNDKAKQISVQIVSMSKAYNIMSLPHAIITIANEKLQEQYQAQIKAYSFGYAVNSFSIEAVTTIMKGDAQEWLGELTEYLYHNLQEILDFIEKENIPLKPFVPEGGFLLWLDCSEAGIGTEHLDQFFMERAHIHLDDGEENFGSQGKGFVRINYAVTNEVLKTALKRIKNIFEEK